MILFLGNNLKGDVSVLSGDIGGYMELLLGASAVTVFESLDLIFYNCFLKCVERTKPKPEPSHKLCSTNKDNDSSASDKE